MLEFWQSFTTIQQTLIMGAVLVAALFVLWAFVFRGTDFSGFGDWIKSWFK